MNSVIEKEKKLNLALTKLKNLNLKNPKNLKLIPYVIGQSISKKNLSNSSVSQNGDFGTDIKYSLTPGLTMDLTFNTDFAQVEVDGQREDGTLRFWKFFHKLAITCNSSNLK